MKINLRDRSGQTDFISIFFGMIILGLLGILIIFGVIAGFKEIPSYGVIDNPSSTTQQIKSACQSFAGFDKTHVPIECIKYLK